jgi:hypothetical protein
MDGQQLYRRLVAIRVCDPDARDIEPTDADYAAHEAWAVEMYGQEVWDVYRSTDWAEATGA